MKKSALFALLCLFALTVQSQQNDLHTWENKRLADTVRMNALCRLISSGYLTSQPDSALYYTHVGYEFARKKNIDPSMADFLLLQAKAHTQKKDYSNAIKSLDEARQIATTQHLQETYAAVQMCTGEVYYYQKDYDKALEYFRESSEKWEALQNKKQLLKSLLLEGRIYDARREFNLVNSSVSRIFPLAVELNDKSVIMGACYTLGRTELKNAEFSSSYKYYSLMLKTAEETQDKFYLPASYSCMANLYVTQGNYPKAIDYYEKAMDIDRKNNNKTEMVKTLTALANIHMLRRDLDKALELFNEALVYARETGNKKIMVVVYNSLAGIYSDQHKDDEAVATGRQCIALARETKAITSELYAYNTLGKVFVQARQYDSAIVWAGKAIELSTKNGEPSQINYAYLLMALAHYNLQHYDEAKKYIFGIIERDDQILKRNFPVLSEKEQEFYFNTLIEHYSKFYTMGYGLSASDPSVTDRVYNTVVRNKGMLLRSSTAMRQSVLSGNDTALIRQYETWIELNRKISLLMSTGKDSKTLEDQANEMEKELVKKSDVIKEFGKASGMTWETIQAGLHPREAAIEFIRADNPDEGVNEKIYYALLIKPGMPHPQMFRLCAEKQLMQVLNKGAGNNLDYIGRIYGTKKRVSDTLYQLLWKPFAPQLKGIRTIYLSPDGLLHKVSFAAISKDHETMLCDAYEIRLQGSTAGVLNPESSDFSQTMKSSVFGGIDYDSDQTDTEIWDYLQGTKTESDNIVTLLKDQNVQVDYFSGREASESGFKNTAGQSDILHIATHGFFYPDPETMANNITMTTTKNDIVFRGDADMTVPGIQRFVLNKNPLMRSGLVFAGANDVWKTSAAGSGSDDGVLTAQEVTQMDLRKTRLVVLSACETGLGDIKGSEGVYGLQRAFKMAGSKFLVMSLWQVPDKETEEFMVTFYRNMLKEKDIRKAFGKTQKEFRQRYDPYFWAAFVLIG